MRAFIANTDYDWYRYLSQQASLEEVNFWKPSGGGSFKALRTGEPFFFKLKKAHGHKVVGFGLFVLFRRLPVAEAWYAFGESNGAATREEMWARVTQYTSHRRGAQPHLQHQIGCILLATPIFFPESLWVDGPSDWRDQIVAGKGYSTTQGEGRRIWNECMERAMTLALPASIGEHLEQIKEPTTRYGKERLVRPRLGQGTFRYAVEAAYGKCAVTSEHSLPALEAAHIVPYSAGGEHAVDNGLLLRADIHKLFDRGYVTVTPDYRFKVSSRLADEFHNGKVYYALKDRPLYLPSNPEDYPRRTYLERHHEEVYLGA